MTDHKFLQVRPKSSVSGANFASELQFEYDLPGGMAMIPSACYLAIKVNATYNSTYAAGPPVVATYRPLADLTAVGVGIENNASSAPFSNASLLINSVEVNSPTNVAECDSMFRLLHEAPGEQESGTLCPMTPASWKRSNAAYAAPTVFSGEMCRTEVLHKNAVKCGANRRVFTLQGRIPIPFYKSDDHLHGNARIQTNLTVREGWRYGVVGVQNGADADDWTLANPPTAVRSVQLEVEDMALYIRTYRTAEPVPRGVRSVQMSNWFGRTNLVTAGEDIDLSLPRGSYLIAVGFLNSVRNTSLATSTTDFCVTTVDKGYTADNGAVASLRKLHFEVGGQSLPTPELSQLDFRPTTDIANVGGSDNDRAYAMYLEASSQARAAAGVVMTKDAFERSPVFAALIPKTLRDQSQRATIRYTCPDVGTPSTIFIFALYSQSLDIEYDDMANPVSTTISSTIGPMDD